jgi:hypothetical protein
MTIGILKTLNESKLFTGIIMLILNIGSRYIDIGFSKTQEQLLRNLLIRELLIFSIAFTSTRDIVMSIIVTAAFIILADFFFHEKSKYCIISDKMRQIQLAIDINQDNIISPKEEEDALMVLKRADKQRQRLVQSKFMNTLNVNSLLL